jgi:hypothetical protein
VSCLIGWLVSLWLDLGAARVVTGSILVLLLPGLALVRLLGLLHRSPLWTLVVAGSLSPPLLAAVLVLLGRGNPHLDRLGALVVAASAGILLWPARPPRKAVEPPVPEHAAPAREDRSALLASGGFAALVALGYLSPWVRQWSDAWFHAAVFHEVIRAGVPPEFPHFAGQALPYPWLLHVSLAGARWVVSPDPFVLLAAQNVWAAFLLPLAVYLLARALGGSPPVARVSLWAAVLGLNPMGPVMLLVRALVGETRGMDALLQAIGGTNAIQTGLSYGFPFFQASLLARLWTPTAFNLAVAQVGAGAALLVEAWSFPRPRILGLLALLLCLILMWHTLTAYALAVATTVAVAAGLAGTWRRDRFGGLMRAARLALAGVAAYLAARPFLALVTLGSAGGQLMHWRLSHENLWGLGLALGPLAVAGAIGLGSVPAGTRPLVAGLLAGFLGPFLFFDLPGTAEEKLLFPLFVLLAALAGPGLTRAGSGRLGRIAVIACLAGALAASGMTATAFMQAPRSMRLLFDDGAPTGASLFTPDEQAGLRWARERSPRSAVFLQSPRMSSNEPVLVYGERRLFLGPAEFFYRAIFFPAPDRPPAPTIVWEELQRRHSLQSAVFSTRPITADTLALLRAYPWPLYVWWDSTLGGGLLSPTLAAPESGAARVVLDRPTVRLLELTRRR